MISGLRDVKWCSLIVVLAVASLVIVASLYAQKAVILSVRELFDSKRGLAKDEVLIFELDLQTPFPNSSVFIGRLESELKKQVAVTFHPTLGGYWISATAGKITARLDLHFDATMAEVDGREIHADVVTTHWRGGDVDLAARASALIVEHVLAGTKPSAGRARQLARMRFVDGYVELPKYQWLEQPRPAK